ncbi:unnamed protein product, partial [Darwinula stevensoni]
LTQVLSGDAIIVRGQPKGGPPPEKTIGLSSIVAPRLGRRATGNVEETKDEPFAWEAREFLRKKLIGKQVNFVVEHKAPSGKEYGYVYLGKDIAEGENVAESLVSEGLVSVRRENIKSGNDVLQKLIELEDAAKAAGKGKWGPNSPTDHVRDIKWTIENPRNFVDKMGGKPIPAVIEHVRDGSTVRAFLLPDFYHITLMLSGIRSPMFRMGEDGKVTSSAELFAEEARFFTESRLLQRDVEIILESVNNNNFVGTIRHPHGNIAEALLKEGFARCVDWSMAFVTDKPEPYRNAEKLAKEKKLKIWKNYTPSAPQIQAKDKQFSGKVVEVINADAMVIKLNDGTLKKVFLSSIRPPRLPDEKSGDGKTKGFRPLYDVPFMYEAREFLRNKLIHKKVMVTVDYIQPASNAFPERMCCTVHLGDVNVAEALLSKGLATVVRYRQDDDKRSSHYDELLAAEMKAAKSGQGLHSTKELVPHRVADLAGINCPRAPRQMPGSGGMVEGEPWGQEALQFTKDLCLQREVEIEVDSMDKAGNFIGWLWVEGKNLSVALVEEGFASVHFTAERSKYYSPLTVAQSNAKEKREKIWMGYEEQPETPLLDDTIQERKIDQKKVVLIGVTTQFHISVQMVEKGTELEGLMEQIRQEFTANPPLTGAYTPKRGDICAAKYDADGCWYRARVEKVLGKEAHILFIDYGNREITETSKLASLPSAFQGPAPYAVEYGVAFARLPPDIDFQQEVFKALMEDSGDRELLLNVEFKTGGVEYVSLLVAETKEDIVKGLISDGLLLVDPRREKRFKSIIAEYMKAEETARKEHRNLWQYGDVTEDDATEFGLGKR